MNLFNLPDSITDLFDTKQIEQKESLQRSAAWFEQRRGKFTGSKIKELMSCTPHSKGMEWGRPEKIIDFSETAKKYIFSKAKERQRRKVLKRSIGKNGDFGTNAEERIIELLKIKYPESEIKEVGFMEFLPGVAGASPDGLFGDIGLEMKAATTWEALYLRHEVPFTESSGDWWQIQSEMLALDVKELLYVVSEPPEDLDNPEITHLSEKIIDASPIHQDSIIHRCKIGDTAIKLYLDGVNFHESIVIACTDYQF